MKRALLRAPRCYQEAFRGLSSVPNPTATGAHQSFSAYAIYSAGRRTLSTTLHLRSDRPPPDQNVLPRQSSQEKEESLQPGTLESSPHIPWYLQETAPITTAEISSRDQIPELPEDPPAILPVLLDYTFKDLGLDQLKLFDLRGLETPPALGANVIMIIGTARSVKHLNVSADRLCRWLRSNYKLSPYADGLLGRNELKIKLRRKARRLRIASRTGTMYDDKDDGITTGWICVNAGVVEKAAIQEPAERQFEGFGHLASGTRVVVQIFTEEKRAEVDLEGLWQQNLDRLEREKNRNSEASRAPDEVRPSNSVHTSPSDREFGHTHRPSVSLPYQQKRQLHSTRSLRVMDGVAHDLESGPGSIHDMIYDRDDSALGVSTVSLFQYLAELPNEKVLSELGEGSDDYNSTLFLRLFYSSLSGLPTDDVAVARMDLMCVAISRQHPGYSKESLFRAFMEGAISGCSVSDKLGFRVVSALLSEHPCDDEASSGWLPSSDKELALRVLDHLILRGTDAMNLEMFNTLYTAASLPDRPNGDAGKTAHISRMIDTLDLPFDPEHARSLMISLFENGDYDGFWRIWRKLPLNNSPRTYDDYDLLFQLHADLGDRLRARDCVLAWAPMMNREDPPIPLEGPIIQNIMDCLVLAEPEIQQRAEEESRSGLVQLWNECQARMDE